ncbi:polymeric immunoglobulin receptor-like isoform X1 [Scophthalmus maximus]|uniref:polymeric immunoglobulin receptor-like isoform X1 n=1 Tax=Scophthalmus maximus TaxID=52904 RepID=UPI0015E11F4D|nr:polymeric immunoglobulin receptor-like isoform X1 [Scophthalmus maximus]
MNQVKRFILLILSLATGCEVGSEVTGCANRWAQFSWKYTKPDKLKEIKIPSKSIKITCNNAIKGRCHCYHDTKSATVWLVIKELRQNDAGEYSCILDKGRTESVKLELNEKTTCQKALDRTAYATAKTTIACEYPDNDRSSVKFFCKKENGICEEIVSTRSSQKSKGKFTLSITGRGFDVSISNMSSQDNGVYWCGFKIGNDTSPGVGLRKIILKVQNATYFTRSPKAGENLTYWCIYKKVSPDNIFICKGEDPSICQTLVNTTKPNVGKFSMTVDKRQKKIFVTVRGLTAGDSGAYWCGAGATDRGRSRQFFNRLILTVDTDPTTHTQHWPHAGDVETSRPSDHVTPAPDESRAGFSELVVSVILVSAAVPLLLLILILIYKRCSHSHGSGVRAAARQDGEVWNDYEMQEHVQTPDAGNDLHTNISDSPYYNTIHFRAGGGPPTPRPSSSACEYTTLKFVRGPSDRGAAEDPIYSNVNEPKLDRKI